MSRAVRLALCLPLLVVSCEGLADPQPPKQPTSPPPSEVETMPARYSTSRGEPAPTMRCRIYFGCVAASRSSD
jgi:hypothetical protein